MATNGHRLSHCLQVYFSGQVCRTPEKRVGRKHNRTLTLATHLRQGLMEVCLERGEDY